MMFACILFLWTLIVALKAIPPPEPPGCEQGRIMTVRPHSKVEAIFYSTIEQSAAPLVYGYLEPTLFRWQRVSCTLCKFVFKVSRKINAGKNLSMVFAIISSGGDWAWPVVADANAVPRKPSGSGVSVHQYPTHHAWFLHHFCHSSRTFLESWFRVIFVASFSDVKALAKLFVNFDKFCLTFLFHQEKFSFFINWSASLSSDILLAKRLVLFSVGF